MSKNRNSLSQLAYDHILDLIMTKQLCPGDRIAEVRIAEEFGISRTPVRTALRHLANQGLVDIAANRFATVSTYTPDTVRDIGMLRISLDSIAFKLAMLYGNHADFLRLYEIADKCRAGMEANDQFNRRTEDCNFHLELAKISHNKLLVKYHTELYLRMQFILLYHTDAVVNTKRHVEQHFEIVSALMNHDEALGLEILTDHLSSFYLLDQYFPRNFLYNLPSDLKL
ncbi:MAG: GntR family transcriptional regulator [Eubacteriales bacterium]|nr:GntR family transcriptional regulator [Eubacteriales bacterium]